jgi:flagellar motor switch protein FliM
MEALLNLAELDSLREKARGKTSAVLAPGESAAATAFDPRQAGQPSAAQLHGLETLHHGCALKIAAALGAALRVSLEVEPAPAEQISAAEWGEKLPAATYLARWGSALGASALLQLDLSLVFPLLDRLLGGTGQEAPEARDLTEIEQEIWAPLGRELGRALRAAWEPAVKLEGPAPQPVPRSEAAALFPPAEQLLVVPFQLRLPEAQGRLLLAFPAALAAVLLRPFLPPDAPPAPRIPRDSSRLREQLLAGRFEAELRLPRSTVSIRQLCGLQPGDVVALPVRADELLTVLVAGREMFRASPVRCGTKRGAQVQQVLSIVAKKEGEERT